MEQIGQDPLNAEEAGFVARELRAYKERCSGTLPGPHDIAEIARKTSMRFHNRPGLIIAPHIQAYIAHARAEGLTDLDF